MFFGDELTVRLNLYLEVKSRGDLKYILKIKILSELLVKLNPFNLLD